MIPDYRRAARSTPCPRCNAQIGEPCQAPSGRRATYEHVSRQRATRLAFHVGIESGLSEALELLDWQSRKSGVNVTVGQVREVLARQHRFMSERVKRAEGDA